MDFITSYLPDVVNILKTTWLLFIKGGWVVFVMGILYMMYVSYLKEIRHQYIDEQEWVFLNIKVPRENLQSTLAVEAIFAQMHAIHTGLTFPQIYVEGKEQLWYSLELVSLGGKISFLIRTPKKMQHLVEASFYSKFPQIEISEVDDYMKNFEFDPENPQGLELWGTEVKLTEPDVFPIRTYKDFEHPTAEEKIIDPLSALFESLAKMGPNEFFGVQILIQPLADDEWKPRGEKVIKELIGEEPKHDITLSSVLLAPFNWFAKFSYKETIFGGGHGHGEETTRSSKNDWMSLTETQKARVTGIEEKISKPGYFTKIRFLYIAPKEHFDGGKRNLFPGSYRILGNSMTNKMKPDVSKTMTNADYRISETLEKPWLTWVLNKKIRNILKGYKTRNVHIGSPMFVMNTEEIATIYHFPITTKTTTVSSTIERSETKTYQPPVNLPIVEE